MQRLTQSKIVSRNVIESRGGPDIRTKLGDRSSGALAMPISRPAEICQGIGRHDWHPELTLGALRASLVQVSYPDVSGSVVRAILLLVEGLHVKRAGRGRCNAGEGRQGDQSGNDGLHSFSPR
jgi:hypothetical protein